jgi:uncharacterized protein (TIGR03066 family)
MTARILALPAILVALFAISWSPARDDLPQAPAPRPKADGKPKPWSELLVGTWKMVKSRNMQLAPGVDAQIEFTKDGKFVIRVCDPKNGDSLKTGTYTLNGNTIRLTRRADEEGPEKSWEITIESLSADELKTAAGPAKERELSVFKRLEKR